MIRFGICHELFEGRDFAETCAIIKPLGYEGIEIAPFLLGPDPRAITPARRSELRRIIDDAGLETIGTHWLLARTEGLHLTDPDPQVRRRTGDYLVDLADLTRDLGGKTMVFGSPKQRDLRPGVTRETATRYAVEVFTRIMPRIREAEIIFCLEPLAPSETDFLNTCAEADAIIRAIGDENFRLQLDVKAQSAEPDATVPELFLKWGEHAAHVHAQDTNRRGPGMGEVDFVPILRALVDADYDRWVSVEVFDFSAGDEETARISIETLTAALEAAIGAGY